MTRLTAKTMGKKQKTRTFDGKVYTLHNVGLGKVACDQFEAFLKRTTRYKHFRRIKTKDGYDLYKAR